MSMWTVSFLPRALDLARLAARKSLFILADTTAIEVKAKEVVGERDLRGLRALREEGLLRHYVLASLEPRPRNVDGISILPWKDFLERLWDGAFV